MITSSEIAAAAAPEFCWQRDGSWESDSAVRSRFFMPSEYVPLLLVWKMDSPKSKCVSAKRMRITLNLFHIFVAMLMALILLLRFCITLQIIFGKPLVWVQNKEGLFSQFLQMRIMAFVTREAKELELVIPHLFTTHMNKTAMSMCDIYKVSKDVRCVPALDVNVSMCRTTAEVIRRVYYGAQYYSRFLAVQSLLQTNIDFCYRMTVPFLGGETRRDAFLRAISFSSPRFEFHASFRESFRSYKRALVAPQSIYTVVHWRRGDQLSSRCLQGKDNSVNCRSAQELISLVRQYSNDSIVYVATNEADMNSPEMRTLRAEGFQVFNTTAVDWEMSSVTAFVVDVRLMLDATTFLGWGVSIINDIVEHERMLRNKTFCVARDVNVTYPTWCWLQEERMRVHIAENHGVQILTSRELALREDQNMTVNPLLISAYNISNMPVYRAEIEENARRMKRAPVEALNSTAS